MFLGIDTSAYTTSLAVVDDNGSLLYDRRLLLEVPKGEQGLRQSKALFYHLQNLPKLTKEVFNQFRSESFKALAVSVQPRPGTESYMPVFLAGRQLAESLAAVLQIPLGQTTHQEGHLAAGLWSAGCFHLYRFLAVHLSGGTTDIMLVENDWRDILRFQIELLGTSADLHAGQFVDRIGVAMGLPFPAGPALEQLAQSGRAAGGNCSQGPAVVIKSAVKGYNMSFSGAEAAALRLLARNVAREKVAGAVEQCLAISLEKVLRRAVEETGIKDILLVGGVAANGYLRQRLSKRLEHPAVGAKLYFPHKAYSSDNAVGVSIIARSMMQRRF